MTLIATQVKRRRGTTAENDAFTGAEGEITVDLTTHELRVHDGSTQGGHTIPTKDYGYSKTESDNLLSNKANTSLSNIVASGKEVIAHQAMPDLSRAYNIILPASGNYITAPNDGYFLIVFNVSSNGFLCVGDNYYHANSNGGYIGGLVPVQKYAQLFFQHMNLVESIKQQFVPAVGAQ